MAESDENAAPVYTDHEARALLRARWPSLPDHQRKEAITARKEALVALLDAAVVLFQEYGFTAGRMSRDQDYQEPWMFLYPDNVERTVALRIDHAGEVAAYYPRMGREVPDWSLKLTYDPSFGRFFGPKTATPSPDGAPAYRSALDDVVRAVIKALYRD